jgi:hypothetical protein
MPYKIRIDYVKSQERTGQFRKRPYKLQTEK